VSTRNPLHLLAGANDYRTVDIAGLADDGDEAKGDAWLGVFKSYDGGSTWRSTLLPGYPQDRSPQGLASPLKGYAAGADGTIRAGTNGLFYYSGIAFNRGTNGLGTVFVARFLDSNHIAGGDSIAYLSTTGIDTGTAGQFIDKPSIAVDIPRRFPFTVQLTDSTGHSNTQELSIFVAVPPAAFTTSEDTNILVALDVFGNQRLNVALAFAQPSHGAVTGAPTAALPKVTYASLGGIA